MDFQSLIDHLKIEEVERARRLGPDACFREAMQISQDNIDRARALGEEEMFRRYAAARALNDHQCYGPPQPRL